MSVETLDQFFVPISEAARILNVSVQRVHALIKPKSDKPARLPSRLHYGRYELPRDAVESFAKQVRPTGRPKKNANCS